MAGAREGADAKGTNMNERTQTRLAWALSASLLAAGWLFRYLPDASDDPVLSCAEPTPRAVAVVLPNPADPGTGPTGERVYVYWLDDTGASQAAGVAPPAAPNAAPATARDVEGRWRRAGTVPRHEWLDSP